MKAHEVLLNVDNKEIFGKILGHAVDYLLGLEGDYLQLTKNSHKYGFLNPEEFESAVKFISNIYKSYFLNVQTREMLLLHFSHVSPNLQLYVPHVIQARKPEVASYLFREYNSKDSKLLVAIDWDVRTIICGNFGALQRKQIARIVIHCVEPGGRQSSLHIELDRTKLVKLIKVLEHVASGIKNK